MSRRSICSRYFYFKIPLLQVKLGDTKISIVKSQRVIKFLTTLSKNLDLCLSSTTVNSDTECIPSQFYHGRIKIICCYNIDRESIDILSIVSKYKLKYNITFFHSFGGHLPYEDSVLPYTICEKWSTSGVFDRTPSRFKKEFSCCQYLKLNPDPILSNFSSNKLIGTNPGYRPDILYTLDSHSIIVEVDEHQHNCYTKLKEHNRMIDIQKNLNRPTIFIRFNPDPFYIGNEKFIIPLEKRFQMLSNTISFSIRRDINFTLDILYLYYDRI